MKDVRAIGEEALAAAHMFASRSTVYFSPDSGRDEWIASATVLMTPRGQVVLLTAKHNFDDYKAGRPYLVGRSPLSNVPESPHPDAVVAVHCCPEEVDVALVQVSESAARYLTERAVALGVIAFSDEDACSAESTTIAAGYPWSVSFRHDDDRQRVATRIVSPMTYCTAVNGRDERGLYRVEWSEVSVRGEDAERLAPAGLRPGIQQTPLPHGISGGGLWSFRSAAPDQLWTPEQNAKLLGVLCLWRPSERTQFAEAASKWRGWLSGMIASVDAL